MSALVPPRAYLVIVNVSGRSLRCGNAKTIEEARAIVANEKKRDTSMGGLLPRVPDGARTWEIWKADWQFVE